MDQRLAEYAETLLHLAADPENGITFTDNDEAGVAPVAEACRKGPEELHTLTSPLNRNAFLCGCLDATEHEAVEHLIVGFGRRFGSTTKVGRIAHARGVESSVAVPPHFRAAITDHVQAGHANEVVLFHNHPPNWINSVFDNLPIASMTDRAALTGYHADPIVLLKTLVGGGRIRFYIGENGFVREFRTPHLRMVFKGLERLGLFRNRAN